MVTDPILKSKRVFPNAKNKALQGKLEGKNTPFQNALRLAERKGQKDFMFEGKKYAARTYKSVPTVKAKLPPRKLTPPKVGPSVLPSVQPFPSPSLAPTGEVKGKIRNSSSFKKINQSVNARKVKNISPTGTNKRGGGRNAKKRGLVN